MTNLTAILLAWTWVTNPIERQVEMADFVPPMTSVWYRTNVTCLRGEFAVVGSGIPALHFTQDIPVFTNVVLMSFGAMTNGYFYGGAATITNLTAPPVRLEEIQREARRDTIWTTNAANLVVHGKVARAYGIPYSGSNVFNSDEAKARGLPPAPQR